jgi:hypothetical protein
MILISAKEEERIMHRPLSKLKTYLMIITALAICMLLTAGCAKEQKTAEVCDLNLNLNAPELEERNVTVNGGVMAPVKGIQWDWGDGKIDKHRYFPARHTYAGPGRYEIKTTAFSIKGCSEEKAVVVNIK